MADYYSEFRNVVLIGGTGDEGIGGNDMSGGSFGSGSVGSGSPGSGSFGPGSPTTGQGSPGTTGNQQQQQSQSNTPQSQQTPPAKMPSSPQGKKIPTSQLVRRAAPRIIRQTIGPNGTPVGSPGSPGSPGGTMTGAGTQTSPYTAAAMAQPNSMLALGVGAAIIALAVLLK